MRTAEQKQQYRLIQYRLISLDYSRSISQSLHSVTVLPKLPMCLSVKILHSKLSENKNEGENAFQTSSTPTKSDRPKSGATTRSRSSPLRTVSCDTRISEYRLHFRASRTCSHQQGWRFCGSFKELSGGTSTLK